MRAIVSSPGPLIGGSAWYRRPIIAGARWKNDPIPSTWLLCNGSPNSAVKACFAKRGNSGIIVYLQRLVMKATILDSGIPGQYGPRGFEGRGTSFECC
jgi:hypothetical protein